MATPGRKPLPAAENQLPALVPDAGARMLETANSVHDIEKTQAMQLGMELGRIETATFFGNISDSIALSVFENVKKSKAWRILKNKDGEIFQSIDDFCQEKIGYSYRRMQQITSNLKALGQETFEQAERLGLRQVDYNAIKALPAPDQELIRRAVEELATKDEVLGVLQELAAKHSKEREALTAKVEEATAELVAKDRVLTDKSAVITRLESASARKFKPREGSEAQSHEEQALIDELDSASMAANLHMCKLFLAADAAIEGGHRESIQVHGRQAVEWLAQQLAEMTTEFGIAVNFEEMVRPAWLNNEALDAMEARQTPTN